MKRSFTFIELLVVVAIIAVLSFLNFPKIKNTWEKFCLDNFAHKVYSLCLLLQDTAVRNRNAYCLAVDPINREVKGFSAEKALEDVLIDVYGKKYQIPPGMVLSSEKKEICFYPDASTDEASIIFEDAAKHTITLNIAGATGDITIE